MAHEIDPQSLIDSYGLDAVVKLGDMETTMGQAFQLEALCPVKPEDRQDPAARARYIAKMLAAGESLLPEHEHLLDASE